LNLGRGGLDRQGTDPSIPTHQQFHRFNGLELGLALELGRAEGVEILRLAQASTGDGDQLIAHLQARLLRRSIPFNPFQT
jgi:hypothetical protein